MPLKIDRKQIISLGDRFICEYKTIYFALVASKSNQNIENRKIDI